LRRKSSLKIFKAEPDQSISVFNDDNPHRLIPKQFQQLRSFSIPSTLSAFLFLAPNIANLSLALFSFRIEESFSMRRSNFSIASLDYLFRMSKFSFAGLLAAAWPFFPGPGREAARIEKFQKSVEVNKRTTKAAEIQSGVLFIQGVSFLVEDESGLSKRIAAPGAAIARSSGAPA